jgi:hypothetical protein
MKPLIPILVVATTSLAVASVQFARQASAQRERADAELVLRQKQDTRIAELERSQARLQRELALAQADDGDAAPVAAAVPETGPPPPPRANVRLGGAFASLEPAQSKPSRTEFFGPRMESPAARNFMRTRLKSSLKRTYEDVGPALGLSQEKANQLLDLLADQQSRNFGRPPPTEDGQPVQDLQKYYRDQQVKNNAEITALIGQDKVDEWADYQKSLPDRAQLDQVREQLDTAGVPMTDSQRTELLTALSEERERLPRPTYTAGVPPEEMASQYKQWQSDYDKAISDRAKQVLTSEQFKSYKEYQDWQAEMRNGMRVIVPGGRAAARNSVIADPTEGSDWTVVSGSFSAVAPAVPTQPERK